MNLCIDNILHLIKAIALKELLSASLAKKKMENYFYENLNSVQYWNWKYSFRNQIVLNAFLYIMLYMYIHKYIKPMYLMINILYCLCIIWRIRILTVDHGPDDREKKNNKNNGFVFHNKSTGYILNEINSHNFLYWY